LRTTYEYNSYNQPIHINYEHWKNQAWQPLRDSTDKYFYYEEVFPASVKETVANSSMMTLYPVPAAKTLNIDIAQQQAAELVFSICTIDGKIIRQWNQLATSGQYKESISVAELPAGNYILKASSNGTGLSKQFQVVR
jgi:Secretion system C-terminal sorting domain